MPPEIHFYNQKGRNTLEAILSPNLNSSYDPTYTFRELTPDDTKQAERLELSADNVYGTVFSSDYFTGRYEVYRMDDPPQRITDFANNFLTIEFREPFKPRRGRINCSLNDNGKWRWFGVQFPIKTN